MNSTYILTPYPRVGSHNKWKLDVFRTDIDDIWLKRWLLVLRTAFSKSVKSFKRNLEVVMMFAPLEADLIQFCAVNVHCDWGSIPRDH